MALDLDKPLPTGSHAWCSDCTWKDDSDRAHANARLHGGGLQHLVHLYVPNCEEPRIDGDGDPVACVLERGHGGDVHTDQWGMSWPV